MATRTYGLSGSGMDVDQLVSDLMKAQRTRYDSMVQKKTLLEWKKSDYHTMYTTINDFRNTVFNYKLSSTLSPKNVTSSDESVATVTANSDAANVTHSLTVNWLAEGVTLTSGDLNSASSKDSLVNQFYGGTAPTPATFNIKISDGATEKEITVDTSKSIYDLVSNINNSGLNIKANYDSNLDRFFLYNTKTGADTEIDFTGSSAEGLTFLQNKLQLDTTTKTGKDASFSLDGVALTQASNSFTISNVTYNLKKAGTITASVTGDTDKTITAVKAFIEAYNSALSKVNAEVEESRYSDYAPLSSEQKAEMSESEITAWETKAKSGMLHSDSMLRNLVDKMRNAIASPVSGVEGQYNSMSALGITTGTYTEGGKLYLDEAKLKKALESDPDIVNKVFSADGDTSASQGVATRMYDILKGGMDNIVSEAGITASTSDDTESTLAKLINRYDDDLYTLSERLADMEDRYYAQFNAMESALNQLNQQSSWLSQQFSSQG
ncbi:MAG: flagellar capping protein [Firmicutes bacterium]|nr:flagellar capping protein [Bacillota bacterium]